MSKKKDVKLLLENGDYDALMEVLTPMQRKFVLAYDGGNHTELAQRIGIHRSTVSTYMGDPRIRRALQLRNAREGCADLVACRLERQMFWTGVMRDDEMPLESRLKASQMLGKSEADFIDKKLVEETKNVNVTISEMGLGDRLEMIKSVYGEVTDVTNGKQKYLDNNSLIETEEDFDFLK